MKILLVGHGKMAQEVYDECKRQGIACLRIFDEDCQTAFNSHDSVAVHFGSGRQLQDLVDLSIKTKIPIIQGSSYEECVPIVEEGVKSGAKIIRAPNLSIPVAKFMSLFETQVKELCKVMDLTIFESHQKGKADVSRTARDMATMAGINHEDIGYTRDPEEQQECLGVPEEHLDGHAYHFFKFEGMGVKIQTSILINGRTTYAKGAIIIAKALVERGPLINFDQLVHLKDVPDSFYLSDLKPEDLG